MSEKKLIQPGILHQGEDGAYLIGGKCKKCSTVVFPKKELCFRCKGEDIEETRVSSHGKLYSYTISHMPSAKFKAPYAVGYVKLDDGVRIFTQLVMDEKKPFKIGTDMEMEIADLWEEKEVSYTGFRFRMVD